MRIHSPAMKCRPRASAAVDFAATVRHRVDRGWRPADRVAWRGGSSGAWRFAGLNYAVIAAGVSITFSLTAPALASAVGSGGLRRAMEPSER